MRRVGADEMMLYDPKQGSYQSNISPLDDYQHGVAWGSLEK
jgi:hypothetical protein